MHDHDHAHTEIGATERPGYFDILQATLEEMLIERKVIQPGEIEHQIDVLDSRTPALGAKVIARAWTDPAFRARLLADGRGTCEELGISFYDDTGLIVLENTEKVHNLVVCTLCSCYPWPVLGAPPNWYKDAAYRSRVVREPRVVLREMGCAVPDAVGIRVWDSSAEVRYLVVPERPEGTADLSEGQLAGLVTRDSMIGVARL